MSLESMKNRIIYNGGAAQQDRMIKDKLRSMLSATKYSYQAAQFLKYPHLGNNIVTGLFNPITQNLNWDTKMISVDFKSGFKVGDIFLWKNTKTYWLCYSQDLTELAYFKGSCRRCDYKVKWVDGDRKVRQTYISVMGPTQPEYRSYQPNNTIVVNQATADLTVLISANQQNLKYFNQNQTFLLKGRTYKITQVDDLSLPGILQLNCVQNVNNLIEDDIEKNVKNTWNIQPVIEQYPTQQGIDGPVSVKPLFPFEFNAVTAGGFWYILQDKSLPPKQKLPLSAENNQWDKQKIVLTWQRPLSGSYTLCYQRPDGIVYQRHIIVQSLM